MYGCEDNPLTFNALASSDYNFVKAVKQKVYDCKRVLLCL